MKRSVGLSILLGWLSVNAFSADIDDLRAVFWAALADKENNQDAKVPDSLSSQMEKVVQRADTEQVKSLLELGADCLRAPGLKAQVLGLTLMWGVSITRPNDGPKLLAPYLDSVASFLDLDNQETKGGAIWILGQSRSPKGLAYIALHLNDKSNSRDMAMLIGADLLESRDAAYVQKVLALVEQRPDLLPMSWVINALGLYQVTTPDALKLIRQGLRDPVSEMRRVAIDAVGHLPKEVRKSFEKDLLQVMAVPDIDPKVRERAQQVVVQ